jgi:hypothetical protein
MSTPTVTRKSGFFSTYLFLSYGRMLLGSHLEFKKSYDFSEFGSLVVTCKFYMLRKTTWLTVLLIWHYDMTFTNYLQSRRVCFVEMMYGEWENCILILQN